VSGRGCGQGEEGVVQARPAQGDLLDGGSGGLHERGDGGQVVGAARGRDGQRAALGDGRDGEAGGQRGVQPRVAPVVGGGDVDPLGSDAALQLAGGSAGGDEPAVDQHDAVGQGVGFLQVLGGEQDRDLVGDQGADGRPDGLPAARVQPGGGLVEDQQPGPGDQAGGQVNPAALAAGQGLDHLAAEWPQVKAVGQLADHPPSRGRAVAAQPGHQQQVLLRGEVVLQGGELPGQAGDQPHGVRLGPDVPPEDGRGARGGPSQGGEHPDDRGLARPVRAEQRQHDAGRDGEVEAVHHGAVRVLLGELLRADGDVGHEGPRVVRLRPAQGLARSVLPGRSRPSSPMSARTGGSPSLSILRRTRPSSRDMNAPSMPWNPV